MLYSCLQKIKTYKNDVASGAESSGIPQEKDLAREVQVKTMGEQLQRMEGSCKEILGKEDFMMKV